MTQIPPERDEQAVVLFVERFAAVLVEAGLPPMPSRVFAALLVTDSGCLTAADLGAQLEASPAAISGAVRYLRQLGMIRRERMPGSRRDVYRVLGEVWLQTTSRRDQVMIHWISAAREGAQTLGPDTPAGRRFAESAEFFEFILKELSGLMARWQEHVRQRDAGLAAAVD